MAAPAQNGRNGWTASLPIIVAVIALGVTLMTTLGGFATFRDYLSIREHEQYKQLTQSERASLRRDIDKIETYLIRVDEEQKRRTGAVERLTALEKRHEALLTRFDGLEKSFSGSVTINDTIKRLESEMQALRSRVMVPIGANGREPAR